MKKLFVLIFALSMLLSGASAFAFGGCEENCQKCHTLDNKDVQEIMTKLKVPDAKVLDIKMSHIKGLWEVQIEDKGQKGILYVGFSKKHIMAGNIFEVETAANKTQETMGKLSPPAEKFVDYSKIKKDKDIVMGDKKAAYKVVVFTDPDWPYCGKLHQEMKKIISERKDIAFFIKLFPLKFHQDAYWKSQSILCSKSIKLLEDNFEKKPVPKPDAKCKGDEIDSNIKIAEELGISGTPTMIMPNGLVVVGAMDAKKLTEIILNNAVKKEGGK